MNTLHGALLLTRGMRATWYQPTTNDWASILGEARLFRGTSKRRLRRLARTATSMEFAPGETIIFPGEREFSLYLLLAGDVKIVSALSNRIVRRGDYFGALSMNDDGPRSGAVIATNFVHVLKLPTLSVVKLGRRDAAIPLRMVRDLTARLGHLEQQAAARVA